MFTITYAGLSCEWGQIWRPFPLCSTAKPRPPPSLVLSDLSPLPTTVQQTSHYWWLQTPPIPHKTWLVMLVELNCKWNEHTFFYQRIGNRHLSRSNKVFLKCRSFRVEEQHARLDVHSIDSRFNRSKQATTQKIYSLHHIRRHDWKEEIRAKEIHKHSLGTARALVFTILAPFTVTYTLIIFL